MAEQAQYRNTGLTRATELDALEALTAEAEGLRRLARRALQEPAKLQQAWLASCSSIPPLASKDPRYVQLLGRSLEPLCAAFCHARLADAELRVTELVLDLRALGLERSAIVLVLVGLEHALGSCAPRREWTPALRALGRFFITTAGEVVDRQGAAEPALQSGVRSSVLPARAERTEDLGLVGESAAMQLLRRQVAALAAAPGPVLIVGPSGTGKELVARGIHRSGPASARPWVAVNCAALPHELIESELFGHEKGAFTGSRGAAPGLMRAAADGTLFLDEITEMPPATQAKLLRALEQRCVRPVGGVQEWPVRARVVAATNREPLEALASGALRTDLFYRLCVHRIDVPALAQRSEDLPLLFDHFLRLLAKAGQRVPLGFSARALTLLGAYNWPGNVRELRNLVEHCSAFAASTWVEPEHLPRHIQADEARFVCQPELDEPEAFAAGAEVLPLHDVERRHIRKALRRTGGNKAQAARLLELSRHQLYVRIERLGITDW